jgi:hypothetical protein
MRGLFREVSGDHVGVIFNRSEMLLCLIRRSRLRNTSHAFAKMRPIPSIRHAAASNPQPLYY